MSRPLASRDPRRGRRHRKAGGHIGHLEAPRLLREDIPRPEAVTASQYWSIFRVMSASRERKFHQLLQEHACRQQRRQERGPKRFPKQAPLSLSHGPQDSK